MLNFQSPARFSETQKGREDHIQAACHKQGKCNGDDSQPLPCRQSAAVSVYQDVRLFPRVFSSSHRSALLKSLFSIMVKCSIMNPFGLPSDLTAF